jgi:hypothetical protein
VGTPVDPVPPAIRAALAGPAADQPGYPLTWGTPDLRDAVVAAMRRRYGVRHLVPDAVLPTIGSKELVAWLPTLLGLGPDDLVVLPELAYPSYEVGARLAGARYLATDATVAVISMIVAAGRIGDLGKIVDEVLARSASGRGELVAEVRSAVALSPEQQQRLAAALSAKTQGTVTVRNVVDPTVLGGVVTTIGDSVLDGSVRTRLTQLRDAF